MNGVEVSEFVRIPDEGETGIEQETTHLLNAPVRAAIHGDAACGLAKNPTHGVVKDRDIIP